jgi:hypothetical protein
MAINWENKGSCKDLSNLLPQDPISALSPTSQEGGNQQSSNEDAMTAPGSQPVDVLKDRDVQVDPKIEASNKRQIEPTDDGKPLTTEQIGYQARKAAWQPPVPPSVKRKA